MLLLLSSSLTLAARQTAQAQYPPGVYTAATTTAKVVALTFDDGPSAYTGTILDILGRYHVPATFFVVGQQVASYGAYVRDEVADGDLVGNHGYGHLDMTRISDSRVRWQLRETQEEVREASGVTPTWFRPPYGAVNANVVELASSLGLKTVAWSVDPADWSLPGTDAIVARVISSVFPGSIVLLHDGGSDRSQTIAALPTIITRLRAEGYTFETPDQLFGFKPVARCGRHAAKIFGARGHPAQPAHAIYKAWYAELCLGHNIGAAITDEYDLARGVVAQDFGETAHRIEWHRSGNRTHVSVVWGWAASAFSRRGVAPLWGHPITHAWMTLYLRHHNRGPALGPERRRDHLLRQHFLRGTAVLEPDGQVVWLRG